MENKTKEILASVGTTFISGSGTLSHLPKILSERGIRRVFLIYDENTYAVAGKAVCELLKGSGITFKDCLFTRTHLEPNERAVGEAIMKLDTEADAVIGVGSGVINDISKIVANVSNKPYVIVATAPSMDGYASATSSMCLCGLKVSVPSKCADVILGDTDILREAPKKMMLAGLGDMLAKYIAICDWRISTLINGEPFDDHIAALVRESLKKCVNNADALLSRDACASEAVFDGLALCGVAMKLAGCSRPASGVEHYISHIWDMRGEEFGTPTDFHGIQCALGTYISASVYEKLLHITPDREKALAYTEKFNYGEWADALKELLGHGADAMIELERKEGKYDKARHARTLESIIEHWEDILTVIREEIPPLSELEALYDKVGLPKSMKEIGLDEQLLPMSFKASKDIRDKYVLSRLCHDLGITDEILSKI